MSNQIRKLQAAFEVLQTISTDVSDTMPVRQALAFVAVALRVKREGEAADLRAVAKDINGDPTVMSRDLLVLGKRGRVGRDGYDLVTVREDFNDLRRRPYVLTKKGEAVVAKLLEAV